MIKVVTGKVSLISYLTKAYSYATILEINLSSKVSFITPGFKTYALTTRLMLVKCGVYHKASSRTFQIYPVYRDSLCMIEKGVFTPKKACVFNFTQTAGTRGLTCIETAKGSLVE